MIWDNCLQYEKQELEKIQIEAARIATGANKLVSIAALYRETRWDSVDERCRIHKLTSFYKMANALSPLFVLPSLVPQTISNSSRYILRNSNDLQTVEARTSCPPTLVKWDYSNGFLRPSVHPTVRPSVDTATPPTVFKGFCETFQLLFP